LWTRRQDLAAISMKHSLFWGVAIFAFAQTIRGLGLYLLFISAEMLSIIFSVTALILILFGWGVMRKVATVVLFLCLMLPWPHKAQALVSLPLQQWATSAAVFCLELLGYEVTQDGNVINMGSTSVAVAEACNGLRMVTAFLVISALMVLLVRRSLWEKLAVLASSLPIAFLCNVIRLTVTAMLYRVIENENVRDMIHSSAGYAMMPLALAFVLGEFWLLKQLTAPPIPMEPAVIVRRKS
jgi:exosortase